MTIHNQRSQKSAHFIFCFSTFPYKTTGSGDDEDEEFDG